MMKKDNDRQKLIFASNLNHFIARSGKLQKDVAKDLGINATTLNSWCTAKSMPPVSKINALCDYFNVLLTDLVDEHDDKSKESNLRLLVEVATKYDSDTIMELARMSKYLDRLNAEGIARLEENLKDIIEISRYTKEGDNDED